MSLTLLTVCWIAAVGLVVGSYLNVVIYRVPRKESTAFPPSSCTVCGKKIKPWDNIPVLSYLILRGKCRGCGEPISARYPFNELLTSGLFVACYLRFGLTVALLPAIIFCAVLVALANIDIEHFELPDRIVFPTLFVGLALQPWIPWTSFIDALLGVLIGAGLLILVINIWYWLRQEEAMGLGDVNMLAMIGAFLGWQGVLVTMAAASFSGALIGIALIVGRKGGLKTQLPFGLFLALGSLVTLFIGSGIVDSYRALL